jgi:hypothetical protein
MRILSRLFTKSQNNIGPGMNRLAATIVTSSITCAELFKESMQDRWLAVLLELIHFFIHITNRASLKQLGDEGRRKLHDKLVPYLFSQLAAIADGLSKSDRDSALAMFTESNYDREMLYSTCTKLVSENPLDKEALFSRLALMVTDVCGAPRNETIAKAVIGVSFETYKEMDIARLVEAAGKEI